MRRNIQIRKSVSKDNDFTSVLEAAVRDVCTVGDGAFKISCDPEISGNIIIEWYPAERVKFTRRRGRIREVSFYTDYFKNGRKSLQILKKMI